MNFSTQRQMADSYGHLPFKNERKINMHYNNLVTVRDVPPTPSPNEAPELEVYLDLCILKKRDELMALYEKKPKDFMIGIAIGECNQVRNQFSREVYMKVPDLMEPTCECTENPKYLAFYNVEDVYKDDFCTKMVDCVKSPDGRIHPAKYTQFTIIDGVVYQKSAGPLKHPKRTKKAKKMTAMPQCPLNKAFKSLGKYLEYLGYEYNDEYKAYGRFANPNGYWDWYALGGRWPAAFLVSDTCHEYGVGDIQYKDSERAEAPKGYQWVAYARKKDINWKLTYQQRLKWSMERFRRHREYFRQQKLPSNFLGHLTNSGVAGLDEMLYIHGENMYDNFVRRGIVCKTKYHAKFYGFLSETGWVDHGYEEDPKSEYIQKLDEFIDSLDDDTVLVAVDCHS